MRSLLLPITALLIAVTPCHAADPADSFAAANQAFLDGEFESARSAYQQLLDDGQISADLLYNLGNACYRLGLEGEAVLWYERTLVLDPTHREARQNLRFLKRTKVLLFDKRQFDEPLSAVRRDDLLRAATCAGWIGVLGLASALTLRLGSGAKTALWIAGPALLLVALAAGGGLYLKAELRDDLGSRAVVTAADAKAFTAPARAAPSVIDLPPGSQVARVSTRGNWDYIDVPGDLRGWVPGSSIKPLWPYDASLAD